MSSEHEPEKQPTPPAKPSPAPDPVTPPPPAPRKRSSFVQKGSEPLARQIVFRLTETEYQDVMAVIAHRKARGKMKSTDSGMREYFLQVHENAKSSIFFDTP